jgi:hypothetical protein
VSHEAGRTSAMTRFRCTSLSREEGKRRGRGSLGEEACKQQYPKKKGRGRGRRDGGSVQGRERASRPNKGAGKRRGALCRRMR